MSAPLCHIPEHHPPRVALPQPISTDAVGLSHSIQGASSTCDSWRCATTLFWVKLGEGIRDVPSVPDSDNDHFRGLPQLCAFRPARLTGARSLTCRIGLAHW